MIEDRIRLWTGIWLWCLSAVIATSLYIGLAGANLMSIGIAVGIVVGLEFGKVLLYRKGGWNRIIAIVLSVMTIVGIAGGSKISLDVRSELSLTFSIQSLHSSREYKDILAQQESLRSELDGLLARIRNTPTEWVTVSLQLMDQTHALRAQLSDLMTRLTVLETEVKSSSGGAEPLVWSWFGKIVGLDTEKVQVLLVLLLATMVEVTAFSLVGVANRGSANPVLIGNENREVQVGSASEKSNQDLVSKSANERTRHVVESGEITPDQYLAVALDHPKRPYLLGRQKTCERLDITEAQARELVGELVSKGRVRREGKFFRVV